MLYLIKNMSNETISKIDVAVIHEHYINIKSHINIEEYSYLLLKNDLTKRTQIIKIFDGINNLKEIIWEGYIKNKDTINHKEILKKIDEFFDIISDEFGLKVVKQK